MAGIMEEVRKWAGWIAVLLLASIVLLQVPRGAVLLAVAAAAGGLYWLLRPNKKVKPAQMRADGNIAAPQSSAKRDGAGDALALARRPLHQLQDVRLAAVILMIQLVRTGAPLTAAEKSVIYELMADPLKVEDRLAMFELAWQMTDRGRVFSPVADDLTPLLIDRLTVDERLEFIGMLTKVANAYGEASDLQREAIVRLKRRLMAEQISNLRLQ
jgi:uncharacterized tellurite resistance protein B-like protein